MIKQARIINRGRGPEIEGTRITVYDVYEYRRAGRRRDGIAAILGLASRQVQVALDYIDEHRAEVDAEYEKIMTRIRKGNPPWVEERLRQNRPKFEAFVAECRKRGRETKRHAGNPR